MSDAQKAAYSTMMGKYPTLAYKIKYGIPPNKTEFGKMMHFLSGPRQVANTPEPFAKKFNPTDATKIIKAVDEIEKMKASDKNFKGVLYSNFLSSGIDPVSRELDRRSIKHEKFTGRLNDKQKKQIVSNYNSGKTPVLLISGAGSEGLDLKGTKLMQILEPHWNEELINQVKGRAIRYKSHEGLPEGERKVKIQRFYSKVKAGKIKSFLQKYFPKYIKEEKSADEYLGEISKKKTMLNKQFLDALQEVR
jgi:SNF2 family DNA or RNA helicase